MNSRFGLAALGVLALAAVIGAIAYILYTRQHP